VVVDIDDGPWFFRGGSVPGQQSTRAQDGQALENCAAVWISVHRDSTDYFNAKRVLSIRVTSDHFPETAIHTGALLAVVSTWSTTGT